MPFTYKLSRRLSVIWGGVIASLTCSASCASSGPAAPTNSIIRLTASPHSIAVQPSDTVTFTAFAVTSAGDSAPTPVTWTAHGGVITSDGRFTAGTVGGAFAVIATDAAHGGLSDTAAVTVAAATPSAQLHIQPRNPAVAMGDSVLFSAYVVTSAGDSSLASVTWGASSGTIHDQTQGRAVFTPAATGQTVVSAVGAAGSDSTTVTVTQVQATAAECANPQTGWIWCDDFEQNRLGQYFEYDSAGGAFTRVAGVGRDGSYGMRAHWDAGAVSVGSLHLAMGRTPSSYFRPVDAGTADYREIYWRLYLKLDSTWTGGGGDKLVRALSFADSNWAEALMAYTWSGQHADTNYLLLDPASGTDSVGNVLTTHYNDGTHERWFGAVRSTTPIFDAAHVGRWHCIEAHVKMNDAGQANGVFELWIDGSPEASDSGLNWVGNYTAYGINAVFFENYWNAGAPKAENRYFDDLVVSTNRIGC